MRTSHITTAVNDLLAPHRYGHRCDGDWYNEQAGARTPCPTATRLRDITTAVADLAEQPHAAAHDDTAARRVAEGMTGLTLADLPDEEATGWLLTGRMAIEALAEHLDRDPALDARAAAVRARLGGPSA